VSAGSCTTGSALAWPVMVSGFFPAVPYRHVLGGMKGVERRVDAELGGKDCCSPLPHGQMQPRSALVTSRLQFLARLPLHGITSHSARAHAAIADCCGLPRVKSSAIPSNRNELCKLLKQFSFLLAKVGVEGSNPFARSKFEDLQRPRHGGLFSFLTILGADQTAGSADAWLHCGYIACRAVGTASRCLAKVACACRRGGWCLRLRCDGGHHALRD
jgi:hypothetical protein